MKKKKFIGLQSLVRSGYVCLLDRQFRNKNKSWKKKFHRSLVFGLFWVCLSVCLFVCLSVHGLGPLPFDLEPWYFVWSLVLGIGKNSFFQIFEFLFFTELCPFFRFLTTSACLSVHGLTPLPFDLESWFFAWALVLAIGKNGFSNFLFFLFFYWVMPLFRFFSMYPL